ncbi:hypothetical protein jhhlp_003011 [Lomentospora prolificans]|uniref:Rhodopsin domain-containing protein n=1 Tax=Lomentospora prolificans TaxID=41688 RepID=A0A2N3NFM6_9PEZI|nr:hypothetical protein jhhlp_003011 [Lomentospora prolificans]
MVESGGGPPGFPAPSGAEAGEDLGSRTLIQVWTLASFAGLLMALRLYCKWLKHRGLWWDDYILIAAWIMFFGDTVCITTSVTRYGLGQHIHAIPSEHHTTLGLLGDLTATLALFGAMWSKTSFAVTMLRLTSEWPRALVWFALISINVFTSVTILLTWVSCGQRWNGAGCVPKNVYVSYSIFAGAFSGAVDLALALLPWYLIWGMRMDIRERLGITVAMSLGVCACAMAILKCIAIPALAKGDYPFDIVPLVVWGNAEVATTIMAASIPVLRVLIRDVGGGGGNTAPFTIYEPRSSAPSCSRFLGRFAPHPKRNSFVSPTFTERSPRRPHPAVRHGTSEDFILQRCGAGGEDVSVAESRKSHRDGEPTVVLSENARTESDDYEMNNIRHLV